MKNISLYLIIGAIVVIGTFSNCSTKKNMIDNSAVQKLEIEKFLGDWYEIARFDHRFERDLTAVKANYSLKENGKIKVVNSGYKGGLNGEFKNIEGKAKIPDPINNPGKLKVSFFWIFYSDYIVMELDEVNYEWAVIGSSSPNYLWVLSRTPEMDPKIYKALLEKIAKRDYDVKKLLTVEQKSIKSH